MIALTHNGRMRGDGGRVWGYQVGNKVFPILGAPYIVRSLESSVQALPKLSQSYAKLRGARHRDGDCVECGTYPNRPVLMQTDHGEQKVIRCQNCGTFMRPHPDAL